MRVDLAVVGEVCPDKADGGLLVKPDVWLLRRILNVFDLLKVLADTRELLEDRVLFSVNAVDAEGGWNS